jgi:hypothetical protein
MSRRFVLGVACALGGCASSLGTVGVLAPTDADVSVKLLRPAIWERACRANVLGVPLGPSSPPLGEALERIFAHDREGDVITNAEITTSQLTTAIYNRRCVEVRGDLGRRISTIVLPAPPSHHGHH